MPEWLDRALVAAAVLSALAYLLWRRRRRRATACGAGECGCGVGRESAEMRQRRPAYGVHVEAEGVERAVVEHVAAVKDERRVHH